MMHNAEQQTIDVFQPGNIDAIWPDIVDLLSPAIAHCHGKYTIIDIYTQLKDETAHLWVACDKRDIISAGITRVNIYPQSKTLALSFAGGDMGGLMEMIPDIKMYAKQLNCDAIECQGRKGWEKVLKPYGFDKVSVTTRMEV